MESEAEKEIKKLHYKLLYETIAIEHLHYENSGKPLERFRSKCKIYLTSAIGISSKTCCDLLEECEREGIVSKGKYDILRKLVEFDTPLLSKISDVERAIKLIQKKAGSLKSRKRKAPGSEEDPKSIDDLLVRMDFYDLIPVENADYDDVVRKLDTVTKMISEIALELILNDNGLYEEFNRCHKEFNKRKDESARILRLFYYMENEDTAAETGKQILKLADKGKELIQNDHDKFKMFKENWSRYNRRLKEQLAFHTYLTKKGAKVRKQLFASTFLFLLFECREKLVIFMDEYRRGILQRELQDIFITEDFLRCFHLTSAKIDIYIDPEDFDSYFSYFEDQDLQEDEDKGGSKRVLHLAERLEAAEQNVKEERKKEAFRQGREILEDIKTMTTLPPGEEIVRLMNVFRKVQSDIFMIKTFYQGKLMEGESFQPSDSVALWEELYSNNPDPQEILDAVDVIVKEFLLSERIPKEGHPAKAMIFEDILYVFGLIQQRHGQHYVVHNVLSKEMEIVWLFGKLLLQQGQFESLKQLCITESRQSKENVNLLFLWAKALFSLGQSDEALLKISEAQEKYQGAERVSLQEMEAFMGEIKSRVEEQNEEEVKQTSSEESSEDDSCIREESESEDRTSEDDSDPSKSDGEESVEIEEEEYLERKSNVSSRESESGLSSPTDDTASLSSETYVKPRRIPLPVDEGAAYTGKDSYSDIDSGLGRSVPSVTSSDVESVYRYRRQRERIKDDDDEIDLDEYLNGIQLSKYAVDRFKKSKTDFRFPYKELEKDEKKLQSMCRNPEFKRCVVEVKGAHEAVCTDLDDFAAKHINISGRSRCGRVFTGDEVVVHILEGGDIIPRLQRKLDSDVYGEIVGFLRRNRHRNINHPVFLCVFDHTDDHVSSVRPICKTVPKLFVRHMKETKRNEIELYHYDRTHQTLTFTDTKYINSKVRHTFVLLVAFVHWEEEIYPKGVILHLFERGFSLKQEFDMLAFQHGIKQTFSANITQAVKEIQCLKIAKESKGSDEAIEVFTIVKSENDIPCHAFSFQTTENGKKYLGIHIIDVSRIIAEDSPLDDEASKRGCTFQSKTYLCPMIPGEVVNDVCKFNEEYAIPTISVIFEVDTENDSIIGDGVIQKNEMKLSYILSYNEVQNIIESDGGKCQYCESENQCHLIKMLNIANNLRKGRLGGSAFAYCLEMELNDDQIDIDVEKHHEVRVITQEFLHLINHYVAFHLQRKGKIFPILHQARPDENLTRNWTTAFEPLWNFVISLQDYSLGARDKVSIEKEELDEIRYAKIIGVQLSLWDQIKEYVGQSDSQKLKELMFTDELHPTLAIAKQQWQDFQSKETISTSSRVKSTVHYSLHLPIYCSITRPLHCYSDLVTQRILGSTSYSVQEMEAIVSQANVYMAKLNLFNKEAKKMQISSRISRRHLSVTAFVYALDKSGIDIIIPGFEDVGDGSIFRINICDLQPSGEVIKEKNEEIGMEHLIVKWEKRLYSLEKKTGKVETNSVIHGINPHQKSQFVRLSMWRSLLKMLMEENLRFLGDIQNVANVRDLADESRKTTYDVSSELKSGLIVNQLCTFTLKFVLGQVISLQIQSVCVNGKIEILPQFLEITSNINICLQHIRDPVSCFELCPDSKVKTTYKSLTEYSNTWIPILLMEAATTALADDSITINHVTVHFDGKGGFFSIDKGFCEMRDIDLTSIPLEFFPCPNPNDVYVTSRADYLCIRCSAREFETQKSILTGHALAFLVLHAKISDITFEEEKRQYKVVFRLHSNNLMLDEKERKIVKGCSIEILPKGEVIRRTEIILKRLDLAETLPKIISIRKLEKIPKLDEVHRKVAGTIGYDIIEEGITKSNTKQREAIHKALHSSFSLIQGPPGTGKTFTAVKLVYLFCKINRCLYEMKGEKLILVFCGPSNKSVDVVARATLESLRNVKFGPKICRLYGKLIEHSVYPIPGRSSKSKRHVERHADEALMDISVHNLIRKQGNLFAETLKEFDEFFASISEEDLQNKKTFRKYMRKTREYHSHVTAATLDEIQKFEAIFCTTAVATKGLLFQRKRVFQIIIDEAGMCTEPETIAAIVATGAKQVVLIGDHKQLRPVISNLDAKAKGLEQSLFESYARLADDKNSRENVPFTRLTTQYRMHEKICEFPSKQFYSGELKTYEKSVSGPPPHIAEIWPVSFSPIVFCHVEGTEEKLTHSMEEGNQMSRKNIEEVEQVVRVYKRLIKLGVDPSDINVMSQYNAQCSLMKKKLANENCTSAHVSTVFQSQGGEWDYVIFSTVCSLPEYRIEPQPTLGWQKANLGFITDEHQINVALTRAKRGLVIIGNKHLLKCDGKVWKKLIKYYEQEKCIVDARLFPKPKRKKRRASTRVDQNEGEWTEA